MAEVLIGSLAEADYASSLLWYAARSRVAAEGFDAEFAAAVQAIGEHPDRYPTCDGRHRFYLLRRYPFQIIYRLESPARVLVVAVAHTSRQPGYWATS